MEFMYRWLGSYRNSYVLVGLLRDTYNCGLRMRRECRERFPRHGLQIKQLESDPGMHHGTCATYLSWCMSGSPTRCGGENVPAIPGACTTRNFVSLVKGPLHGHFHITSLIVGSRYRYMRGIMWSVYSLVFNINMSRCWDSFERAIWPIIHHIWFLDISPNDK